MPPKQENPLEQLLKNKKRQLEHLNQQHLIYIAVFEAKREMLSADIDNIERHFYKEDK